jgi:glycosyltransferase involved in cell wall biosynthesis
MKAPDIPGFVAADGAAAMPAAAAPETAVAADDAASQPLVSVLVPTFRRPALLPKALASLHAQTGVDAGMVEVVVVDNCPDGSAAATVGAFIAAHPGDPAVRYVHEPRPGISHARNRALAAARGRFVLFLDDDQEATPGLIRAYCDAWRATGAAALFGPVEARLEPGPAAPATADPRGTRCATPTPAADADVRAYFSRHYDAADLADITDDIARLGTNNCFFDRGRCFSSREPFSPALGTLGGEDTLVFRTLKQAGIHFVWVTAAVASEFVPSQRQTFRYVRMRRFRSGQITVLTCLRLAPRRPGEAMMWMLVGVLQAGGYGVLALLLRLLGRPRWAHFAARAWGGAGKVLWTGRFRFPAYGAASRLAG